MPQLRRMPVPLLLFWKGVVDIDTSNMYLLAFLIFLAALLYSSVGHGGASGYLAAMALFGLTPAVMKPTALLLNIMVSAIATVSYYRAGNFSWRVFWPFALGSVPFALLGGTFMMPDFWYKLILGFVLLFSSYRLWFRKTSATMPLPSSQIPKIFSGAIIGLVSGLIGVGGGIFLSPLILLRGWADAKITAGVSAAFILVNSIAGITGHFATIQHLPKVIWTLSFSSVLGGIIGSQLGSNRFSHKTLRQILAAVLVVAGIKLTLV